jgi:hypothetical protein
MRLPNQIKETKNNRKHDGKFKKVNINHNSQDESARKVLENNEKG